MPNDNFYTVIPIRGSFLDVLDGDADSLRYDFLSWNEAVELCRLSFLQGYECVIWQQQEAEEQAGVDECGAT